MGPLRRSVLWAGEGPADGHIVVLHGTAWSDYRRVLELLRISLGPPPGHVEGNLELRPSRPNEAIESMVGRPIEVWCLERAE